MKRAKPLELTGENLTTETFAQIVLGHCPVGLAASSRRAMQRSSAFVRKLANNDAVIYGVNTGVGKLSEARIPRDKLRQLQLNIIRSHACGVGEPLDQTETRAVMLLRANVLARGYSGVRPVIVETLLNMLNRNVLPVIPCRGSVGASGDLAALAHLALVLAGEGEALFKGKRMSGAAAMKQAKIPTLQLEAKEGISLVNGTQVMLALGLLSLLRCEILADTADVAGALSLDGLRGTPTAFDPRIHALRPFDGQRRVAANLLKLMRGSEIRESHRDESKDPRVQDQYSLRCIPQVHGTVRDALSYARRVFEIEMNSVTDNPLVFARDGEILSGGNFHGQPLALALDVMAIAMTQLGGISERRIERLTNADYSGLPPFLIEHSGLESGFMMAQVTAAALASENKTLAHPASVDSIPTSANKEDYVSMGVTAALKLKQIVRNVQTILAIELLAASQAVDFLKPLQPGVGGRAAHRLVRSVAPPLKKDRALAKDIEAVTGLVGAGKFAKVLATDLHR
jgi:histidine ammonia-lyase